MKVDYGLCAVCGHNTRLNQGRSAEHTEWRVRQDRRANFPRPVFYDTRKPCPGSGEWAEGHAPTKEQVLAGLVLERFGPPPTRDGKG